MFKKKKRPAGHTAPATSGPAPSLVIHRPRDAAPKAERARPPALRQPSERRLQLIEEALGAVQADPDHQGA